MDDQDQLGTCLEVRGLQRSFGSTRALADCTLTGRLGTVHALLGENGSGKSTLVKILSGVLAPDRGEIIVQGSQIDRFSPAEASSRGVATVFQELLNVPSRSVLDNVFLGEETGFRHEKTRSIRVARARHVLARLGLDAIDVDAPVESLPLSVQQQVAIGRALHREPRILVLDEATSALDVKAQELLFGVLKEELSRGVLVLFITHRMNEIMSLADEVTVLRSGATVAVVARNDIRPERLLGLMSAHSSVASTEAVSGS